MKHRRERNGALSWGTDRSRGSRVDPRYSHGCLGGLVNGQRPPEIGGRADAQWAKAAGGLADGIATGRYAPGERLPTLATMAAAAVVHPRTMSRALRRLRELGYIVYRPGYGYYVSDTPPGQPRPA